MNRRLQGPLWLLGLVSLAALASVLWRGCGDADDPPATPLLDQDSLYQETIQRQDAAIALLDSVLAERQEEAQRQAKTNDSLRRVARRAVADAEAADADLVGAHGATDSLARALAARNQWRSATLYYRDHLVPGLERQVQMEAGAKLVALAMVDTLTDQRDYARARVTGLTREFRDYKTWARNRGSLNLGFVRVPKPVVDAAKLGLVFYGGCRVGGGCN